MCMLYVIFESSVAAGLIPSRSGATPGKISTVELPGAYRGVRSQP